MYLTFLVSFFYKKSLNDILSDTYADMAPFFFSILFVRFQSFMFKIKQLYKNDHLILNRRWDFLDIYKCIIHFHTFLGENSYSSRPRTFTDNLLSLLTDCPAKAIENKLFKCTRTE